MKTKSILGGVAALVLFASSAHAVIMHGQYSSYDMGCNMNVFCDTMATTFSFPTVLVEGESMDMSSPQASERLMAEANGDVEPVLSSVIADRVKSSVEVVKATALQMHAAGEAISAAAIAAKLAQ